MQTTLHARHLDLDERLTARIERKVQRLDRIADPPAHVTVELTAGASRTPSAAHVAAVTLVSRNITVRSTASAATPMAAIDAVIDKLERQVVRAKQRARESRRSPEATLRSTGPEPPASGTREEPGVIEITRLDMVPMFPEDAIVRMDELGQLFHVFLNAQSGRVSVVYRRADGGHGLIDPVVTPIR